MTINKRLVTSGLTIAASGALLVGATFAFFSDTATSNNNQFSSGTLDLHVRDNDQGFQDNVTASTVSPTNWAPGESFESYVCFRNNGNIDIEEILFAMSAGGGNAAFRNAVIADKVELGSASAGDCAAVGGGSLTDFTPLFVSRFDGGDADSAVSLTELLADVDGTDRSEDDLIDGTEPGNPFGILDPGEILKFRTTWKFDSSATSAAAGQTVTVDMTFTANQDELP